MHRAKTIQKLAIGLALSTVGHGWAQYDLSWFTFDGGGGTSGRDDWVLDGTIGQADAGPVMTGGAFRLVGGFLVGGALPIRLGDMNCDGAVNFADINPFVLALSNPEMYQQRYPGCNIFNADCNQDGQINFADINPFVALFNTE